MLAVILIVLQQELLSFSSNSVADNCHTLFNCQVTNQPFSHYHPMTKTKIIFVFLFFYFESKINFRIIKFYFSINCISVFTYLESNRMFQCFPFLFVLFYCVCVCVCTIRLSLFFAHCLSCCLPKL